MNMILLSNRLNLLKRNNITFIVFKYKKLTYTTHKFPLFLFEKLASLGEHTFTLKVNNEYDIIVKQIKFTEKK